jgi:hypothetical protein
MGIPARVFASLFVERHTMKRLLLSLALVGLLSCFPTATATAEAQGVGSSGGGSPSTVSSAPEDPVSSDPTDPSNLLRIVIPERRAQRESLLPVSPLKWLHDATGQMKDGFYREFHLKLGLTFNHLFQGLSNALPGKQLWGTTTDMDFVGTWELLNRGKPSQGQVYFQVEGRWSYGTTGPQNLGFVNLASAGGTANAFSKYVPTFILRNLYWEQGSKAAGWAFRIGKITPDAILATSRHISPVLTFLPNVGTGLFSSGYPDSGLGVVGVWYPIPRIRILGLFSDANADRQNFGSPGSGDFYKAFELGVKIAPKTDKAGFSKFTIWYNDGTKDGKPINASTGRPGWGMTVKLEHEFTADGRAVGVFRWGKSFNDSSIYKQQVGVAFLLYGPPGPARLQNDLLGVAFNWVDSVEAGSRNEYNVEVFYRFPLFPSVDTRLSYQSVINPALTREIDHASVFSLGLRSVF